MTQLDENFNDVTGITANNGAGAVRTVADIVTNDPAQLPPGTAHTSIGSSPNVRRSNNTSNTSIGAAGFDSFFQPINAAAPFNLFLVFGNDSGTIVGPPTSGITEVQFPFEVPSGALSVTVQYDFAFDGTDTSMPNQDSFVVELVNGGTQTLQLLVSSTNFSSGNFNDTLVLAPGSYTLVFRLNEAGAGTNTAAGVDNVLVTVHVPQVQAVPEPASLLLLVSGLAGLGVWRLRRKAYLRQLAKIS
jgi:hypothetical protein